MVEGAPHEARWIRAAPRRELSRDAAERIVTRSFPGTNVIEVQPLVDGRRNSNFLLRLSGTPEPIVLRMYEHDPTICQKEIDLLRLVGASIPVPEVLDAEPDGVDDGPPFVLFRYVEAPTFRELKHRRTTDEIAEAAFSIGETLAAIGQFTFKTAGWLGPGPTVSAPLLEGADPMPRFVDRCLSSPLLQQRMQAALRDRVHALLWEHSARLAALDARPRLVHGDFNWRNILVRRVEGRWRVAAILDWEFGVAGSPLADVGNFFRYERAERPLLEPHFSTGNVNSGGSLPSDWRRLSRIVDLVAICESLTHENLQVDVVEELIELVRATVEDRDPRLA